MPTPAELYPTIAALADLTRSTVGYQKPDLEREAVACYRELARVQAEMVDLQGQVRTWAERCAEADEELARVKAERPAHRGQQREWDQGVKLDELKALAQAATPGPWEIWESTWSKGKIYRLSAKGVSFAHLQQWPIGANAERNFSRHNAAYFAACSPDVILRLIAVIEAADRMRPTPPNLALLCRRHGGDGMKSTCPECAVEDAQRGGM